MTLADTNFAAPLAAASRAEPESDAQTQDRRIAEAVERDQPGLRSFIRRRVLDPGDAEDILQDVFYELTQAYRLLQPIEQVTAWLFRVARNRITDRFRQKKATPFSQLATGEGLSGFEDLLPSAGAGPDALYARGLLLEALEAALNELPETQRDVFVAHEFEGRSFKQLAAETGTPLNTLLARKRYAVLHLRKRLQQTKEIYESH